MFLTQDQVRELTGLSYTASQSDWLHKEKILHFVNARNRVKVTEYAINHPMYRTEEPDFSGLV